MERQNIEIGTKVTIIDSVSETTIGDTVVHVTEDGDFITEKENLYFVFSPELESYVHVPFEGDINLYATPE